MSEQFFFGCIVGVAGTIIFIFLMVLKAPTKEEQTQVIDAQFVDKPEAPSKALVKQSTVLVVKPRNQEVMYGRSKR